MNNINIILIILLIIIFYYNYSYNKHLFWNSSQPIYNKLSYDGIIKNVKDLKVVDIEMGMKIITFNKNNKKIFINFINKNFDQYIIQNSNYIDFNCGIKNILFGILIKNELIGTISGKYSSIKIKNNIHKSIYVDYLCLKKEFRYKHYSPILISLIIKNMKKYNYPTAFYRLDNTKHHFKNFYESSYYYYDLKNKKNIPCIKNNDLKISILDKNNDITIHYLYNYYKKCISKFKIYENITYEEFSLKLKNDISTTLIFKKNKVIIGFLTYLNVNYNIFNTLSNIIEVYYLLFIDNKYSNEIISSFIKNIPVSYKYIYLLNNYYNNYLVQYLNMNSSNKSYFYLYNYYLKDFYNLEDCILF